MNILPVVNQIIMLFLIALVGFALRKTGVFTDPVIKGVNALVLNGTWPAMMLMLTQKPSSPEVLGGFFTVLIASVVILVVTCLILYLALRNMKDRKLRPVLVMLAAIPNAGYIGMPIIDAAYGSEGTLYLAAYIVGFNLVLWTVGVALYAGFKPSSMKGMLNLGFIFAIVGTFFFVLNIQLPTPVLSAVNQLGNMNTPLAMLLLGARMDTLRLHHFADGKLWGVMGLKLLVIPILTLLILKFLGVTGVVLGVIVLSTAMPSAAAGQLFSEKYDMRVDYAAHGISVCTLLCIATIPLILLMM